MIITPDLNKNPNVIQRGFVAFILVMDIKWP